MADTDDRMGGAGVPNLKRTREPWDESSEGQPASRAGKDKGKQKAGAAGLNPSQTQEPESLASTSSTGPNPLTEDDTSAQKAGPSQPPPKKPRMDLKPGGAKRSGKGGGGSKNGGGKKGTKGKQRKKSHPPTSLHLHIRILWNMLKRSSVPRPVDAVRIIEFDEKFAHIPQPGLKEHVEQMLKAAASSTAQVLAAVETVRRDAFLERAASTARNAARLDSSWLQKIFSSVAAVGLQKWEPDLLGHPDSAYNIVHEHVALSTYQALLGGLAYVQIAPGDLVLRNQMERCRGIYRKYVFGYQARRLRLEMRSEGGNEARDVLSSTYKRRARLRDNRVHQLKQEAFRPQILQLALEAEAHSDDEVDPDSGSNNPEYRIRRKIGRSPLVTRLFRDMDTKYHRSLEHQPGQRGDRIRKASVGNEGNNSLLSRLPKDVPIDYFSPDYFNNFLSAKLRAHYAANGVALPLEEYWALPGEVELWKNMTQEEFMEAYGNKVLELYHLPTQDELNQMDDYDYENEGSEGMADSD